MHNAPWSYTPGQQAKAIFGGVLAGLTSLGTAVADGMVSAGEWVGIAIAAVATFGAVFGVGNDADDRPRPAVGAVDVAFLLAIVGVILLGLGMLLHHHVIVWPGVILAIVGGVLCLVRR